VPAIRHKTSPNCQYYLSGDDRYVHMTFVSEMKFIYCGNQ